jgi:hypothetical protein
MIDETTPIVPIKLWQALAHINEENVIKGIAKSTANVGNSGGT